MDDYIREYRVRAKAEMLYHKRQPTLAEDVDIAARCVLPNGNRHPHQRRIPPKSIAAARSRLLAVDLGSCRSFDELHTTIDSTIRDNHMLSALVVYDVSHRIRAFLASNPSASTSIAERETARSRLG